MFINIHAHAYRLPGMYRSPIAEILIKNYDELKIDMGCVLPIVSPEIYFSQAIEDVVEMSQKLICQLCMMVEGKNW